MNFKNLLLIGAFVLTGNAALAQTPAATPASVAAKLQLRGDANDVVVPEIRIVRRNDVMVIQADLYNNKDSNRTAFYRFRWLDSVGNQVGDGESWKQVTILGYQTQTVKTVAHHSSAVDFRLEMNVETP